MYDLPKDSIAGRHAANAAALQANVKDYQARQLKSLAITSVPLVAMAALNGRDRLRAANAEFAAEEQDQLFQIRKQQWITNKLLSGWTMDEVNEEIAAGEEIVAAETPVLVDPFPWGSLLLIVLGAIGVTIALIYGFTHPGGGGTGGAEFTHVIHYQGLGAVSQFLNYS